MGILTEYHYMRVQSQIIKGASDLYLCLFTITQDGFIVADECHGRDIFGLLCVSLFEYLYFISYTNQASRYVQVPKDSQPYHVETPTALINACLETVAS